MSDTSHRNLDLMSLEFHSSDPWDDYAWMRDEAPLYWDETNELWAVSRYEDVVKVSRRTDLFCNRFGVVPNLPIDMWPDEAMINLDGDAHTCQRRLVGKGFTSKRIDALEPMMREVIKEMFDGFVGKGECDVVKDVARVFPYYVICHMLGYPKDVGEDVLDWADIYGVAGSGPAHVTEEVMEAFAKFVEFHEVLLEEKKANPGDDLLSIWLGAEIDGQKLSEDKLLFEHNLLLFGGSETTRTAISMGMQALMENPDQMKWLTENIDDVEAVTTAVEEMIRYSCPFVRMKRTATQDVEMHGKTIKEGDQIIMLYPAANRDPRAFDDPDKFDIRRDGRHAHLAFGFGKHHCLGAALARLETRVCLETFLRRIPDMHTIPDKPAVRVQSCFVRGLSSLPVAFTPQS